MSGEAVAAFLKMLAEDADVQKAVDLSAKAGDAQLDAIVAAAASKGHEFTVAELKSVLDALPSGEEGELTEDELAKAAGGVMAYDRLTSPILKKKLPGLDYLAAKK